MARIFVVEDEEDIFEMIRIALETRGHTVFHSFDGTTALEKIKSEQFDILILDVMIPGMDGYSILEALEKDPAQPPISCIVVTALKPAEKLFKRFKSVKYFLPKPFGTDELRKIVDDILIKLQK